MKLLTEKTCSYLDMQGFTDLSREEKSQVNIALRFTPTLCSITVVFGLYYQSWEVFAVLSVFGLLGTFTKRWHPFDVLYNVILSNPLKWQKLPPAPAPKRFACFIGFIFLLGGTVSFYFGAIYWGYFFGIGYIIAAMLMAITHFCIGSWLWRKFGK